MWHFAYPSLIFSDKETSVDKVVTGSGRGEFRSRQTRQLPRAVDLKGRLLSCQSYQLLPPRSIHLQSDIQLM